MHIQHVEVGNFRKLQSVRIDFSEDTTVLVGANNSGKTSAMVALRRFLVDQSDFSINDFTLSNWAKLDMASAVWEAAATDAGAFEWGEVLPFLDIWLNVQTHELHYVQKLLPTLDWDGTSIGVRLRYEPKDPEALRQEYLSARAAAALVMSKPEESKPLTSQAGQPVAGVVETATKGETGFALWPRSMVDFLSRRLRTTFEVRAYLLDPANLAAPKDGLARPQCLPDESEPLEGDPFKNLICIDEISAQRGFGFSVHTRSGGEAPSDERPQWSGKRLSSQLRSYYAHHLDPFDKPEPKDLQALQALHEAEAAFGERLANYFAVALKELEQIGYPGVTDPKLTITTRIKAMDGLNHASAVQYEVPTHPSHKATIHRLPEDSNGLGYQNLVSIVFALMSFRDKWMKVGKANAALDEDGLIPPLHLVLIEEPEAHLHAQVQQVFIKQAYEVLRNHEKLRGSKDLSTQLVVSTHSSHIAHEADFASLRYFRRLPAKPLAGSVPVSSVVNLSEIFGTEDQTERFVKRYLRAMHCDLFFADGAVLVEGPAERILVPHLVHSRPEYKYLKRCYITWLEIGGSHAHRLKTLLLHLGLNTLIVTDIDAKEATSGKAAIPQRGLGLKARNETLKTWIPAEESFDALLDKTIEEMVFTDSSGYGIRVAYQQPIPMTYKSKATEGLANTFEDALVYENIDTFEKMEGKGLIARFRKALADSADPAQLAQASSDALASGGKAEFALDLLFSDEIDKLKVPTYIHKGLVWLSEQLKRKEENIAGKPVAELP